MFRKKELDRLMAFDGFPAVTFTLPTHMGSREVRQDPVRLRNLCSTAAERLERMGVEAREVERILAPVRSLTSNDAFWLEQSPGIAVFVSDGRFDVMRLPFKIAEELVIGHRFHVRHMLPALEEDGEFLILALTARSARLYEASRYHIAELRDSDLPIMIRELPEEISDPARQPFSDTARARANPIEDRRSGFYDYFARVADVVGRRNNPGNRPLVLVAIEELAGQFRDRAQLRNLLSTSLEENPDDFTDAVLRDRAYELARPLFLARQSADLERFDVIFGQGQKRASIDLREVLEGARSGRVDTLFVAEDTHVWGNLDPAADGFHLHDEPGAEDEDLLDFAAAETLRNGGAVHVLPRADAPFGKPVAALFRY
jgi:hypothetical protein